MDKAPVESDAQRSRRFTLAACSGVHGVQDGLSAAAKTFVNTKALYTSPWLRRPPSLSYERT